MKSRNGAYDDTVQEETDHTEIVAEVGVSDESRVSFGSVRRVAILKALGLSCVDAACSAVVGTCRLARRGRREGRGLRNRPGGGVKVLKGHGAGRERGEGVGRSSCLEEDS